MKTATYNFSEFMKDEHVGRVEVKPPKMSLIPLAAAPLLGVMRVSAETTIQAKMISAFAPIVSLIQGMAYPVALVVVLGGALYVMIGNNEKGFGMMQKAGLGYAIVMIAPMILNVLVDAMKGLA